MLSPLFTPQNACTQGRKKPAPGRLLGGSPGGRLHVKDVPYVYHFTVIG